MTPPILQVIAIDVQSYKTWSKRKYKVDHDVNRTDVMKREEVGYGADVVSMTMVKLFHYSPLFLQTHTHTHSLSLSTTPCIIVKCVTSL